MEANGRMPANLNRGGGAAAGESAAGELAAGESLAEGLIAAGLGGDVHAAWLQGLDEQARALLGSGQAEVWDELTRRFESRLIQTALELTRGRRIEAAQRLGIGRNTITRKIQELGLED